MEIRNLSLGYGSRILLEGANLSFGQGKFYALIGRNGTGKSTLLRTMAGLMKPLAGDVLLNGKPMKGMGHREIASQISFVSTEEVRIGNLRVYDVVGMGRAPYTNWIGILSSEDKRMVEHALSLVGMSDFAEKSIDSLSDGERQRVMIARSLAQDTPVILLDEPTAFLDLPNKYEISLLLKSLAVEHGKTVIVSTHDLNVVLHLCDVVAMIDSGRLVVGKPAEIIENGTIQNIFRGTSLYYDRDKGVVKK